MAFPTADQVTAIRQSVAASLNVPTTLGTNISSSIAAAASSGSNSTTYIFSDPLEAPFINQASIFLTNRGYNTSINPNPTRVNNILTSSAKLIISWS